MIIENEIKERLKNLFDIKATYIIKFDYGRIEVFELPYEINKLSEAELIEKIDKIGIDCADCSIQCINTIEATRQSAQTALAYREMLERARKTLQDAWDDDGSAVIGSQILETINAIDALLGGEKDA